MNLNQKNASTGLSTGYYKRILLLCACMVCLTVVLVFAMDNEGYAPYESGYTYGYTYDYVYDGAEYGLVYGYDYDIAAFYQVGYEVGGHQDFYQVAYCFYGGYIGEAPMEILYYGDDY